MMTNENLNPAEKAPHSPPQRHSFSAATLVRAAALATALLALGSVAATAAPITCGFGDGDTPGCGFGDNAAEFDFSVFLDSLYSLFLDFENVYEPFYVTINDEPMTQGQYADRGPGRCVPIKDGNITCIDFDIVAPLPGDTTWDGFYDMTIFWDIDTNAAYPDNGGHIRLLHNRGDVPGEDFDSDITVEGSYCAFECSGPFESDPAISGLDNNFAGVTVVLVPEPGTLLLLGSALGGVLYRRRRRKGDPAER